MSGVTSQGHVSGVTYQVSCVMCHMSSFLTRWWSYLVEGLLSTGPNPSSFCFLVRYVGGGGGDNG